MNTTSKETRIETPIVSTVQADGTLVELLFDADASITSLLCAKEEVVATVQRMPLSSGVSLVPLRATHSLLKHQVVLLPSRLEEYASPQMLKHEIQIYIRRYVDLSETGYLLSSYYVLLTWIYDAFETVPYLRFKGDFGTGKSRALAVIGSICYKPIFASGASTVSPIFHALDMFRGTLVFDEADFRFSDERAEITKIFNSGTTKGFPVLRSTQSDKKDFEPRAFQVFGPKLIGMREVFDDYALESRFITEEMVDRASASYPVNLPPEQEGEALVLRNKLLCYRIRMRHKVGIVDALEAAPLSPRSRQIVMPLLSVIDDSEARRVICDRVLEQERELVRSRSTQVEAYVLSAVLELASRDASITCIPLESIRRLVITKHSQEFDRPMTSRLLGGLIRNRLRLKSYKSGVYLVVVPPAGELDALCRRYGVERGF